MRRVEGQVPSGFPTQVYQVGAVHHGNGETAETLPLPDGLVVWGSLIVTLNKKSQRLR